MRLTEGKIWVKVTGHDLLNILSDAIFAIKKESADNKPPFFHLNDDSLMESTEENMALEEYDISNNDSPVLPVKPDLSPIPLPSLEDHQPVQTILDIQEHMTSSPEISETIYHICYHEIKSRCSSLTLTTILLK